MASGFSIKKSWGAVITALAGCLQVHGVRAVLHARAEHEEPGGGSLPQHVVRGTRRPRGSDQPHSLPLAVSTSLSLYFWPRHDSGS